MANRLSLLDGHLPEYQSCEASLAPKFEQLAVHLQNHAHKIDGVTAIEAVRRATIAHHFTRCLTAPSAG